MTPYCGASATPMVKLGTISCSLKYIGALNTSAMRWAKASRLRLTDDAGLQDDEFITANPRHHVLDAHDGAQALADSAEQEM